MKKLKKIKVSVNIPEPVYNLVLEYSKEHYLSINDTVTFLFINGLKNDVYDEDIRFNIRHSFNCPDILRFIHCLQLVNRMSKINDVSKGCFKSEVEDNE